MEGLLSLLFFGGLFFLMMRFGCGAHVMHGRHGHSHGVKVGTGEADPVDPVCGMTVDSNSGYGKMHQGRLYRFCSRACLDKFDFEPLSYTATKRLEDKP